MLNSEIKIKKALLEGGVDEAMKVASSVTRCPSAAEIRAANARKETAKANARRYGEFAEAASVIYKAQQSPEYIAAAEERHAARLVAEAEEVVALQRLKAEARKEQEAAVIAARHKEIKDTVLGFLGSVIAAAIAIPAMQGFLLIFG